MTGFPISVDALAKHYRVDGDAAIAALDDVTIDVELGRVVGIVGPSGSGKSTLLHLIGAMDRPDSGSVRVGDLDVTGLSERQRAAYRRTIGFVFQGFHLLPALSALDNVIAPVLPYRVSFDKAERARELLAEVGLAGRERSLPSRLSGGEQQRVAIARALVNDPGLLLADEPTGNLDSQAGAGVMQLVLDLRSRRGTTVLVATHDPLIAARCDRILTLRDGRVVDDVRVAAAGGRELLDQVGRLWPPGGSAEGSP